MEPVLPAPKVTTPTPWPLFPIVQLDPAGQEKLLETVALGTIDPAFLLTVTV